MNIDELLAEARDALGRVNTNAFERDLLFQYRGGVLGREITLIVRDLADGIEEFLDRVEAAALAMRDLHDRADGIIYFPSMARAALEAADAVVTEEMIAETILKALVFTNENSEAWADGLARDIAALFRGGAE